jgi:hypothetical protein
MAYLRLAPVVSPPRKVSSQTLKIFATSACNNRSRNLRTFRWLPTVSILRSSFKYGNGSAISKPQNGNAGMRMS